MSKQIQKQPKPRPQAPPPIDQRSPSGKPMVH
jgi:hypothetical protein